MGYLGLADQLKKALITYTESCGQSAPMTLPLRGEIFSFPARGMGNCGLGRMEMNHEDTKNTKVRRHFLKDF